MRRLFAGALLLIAACGELKDLPTEPPDDIPPDPTATFIRVQTQIFTPTCAVLGCHDRLGQQSQLILSADRAYSQIVNVASVQNPSLRRVLPGDPEISYLYRKLTGVGITDERMPQGGPYLSDAQVKLVRDWIRRGAPND